MKRKASKVSSLGKARRKAGKQGGGRGYSGATPKRTQPSVGAGALRRHTITDDLCEIVAADAQIIQALVRALETDSAAWRLLAKERW